MSNQTCGQKKPTLGEAIEKRFPPYFLFLAQITTPVACVVHDVEFTGWPLVFLLTAAALMPVFYRFFSILWVFSLRVRQVGMIFAGFFIPGAVWAAYFIRWHNTQPEVLAVSAAAFFFSGLALAKAGYEYLQEHESYYGVQPDSV